MARLIDADQFKAKMLSFMDRKATTPSDTDCILDGVLNLLEEQPTADPVKHGHWIEDIDLLCHIRCSECDNGIDWRNAKKPNYCPSCGAKMDGDTK